METFKKSILSILVAIATAGILGILRILWLVYPTMIAIPIKEQVTNDRITKLEQSVEILNAGSDTHFLKFEDLKLEVEILKAKQK